VATAIVLSSIISGVSYTQLWGRSPTRAYVAAIEKSLRDAGSNPALYDTPVPSQLIPLEAAHYVSDVVGLTGRSADFGYAAARPQLFDAKGHIVPARFYVQTSVDLSAPGFCRFPVQGASTVTKRFAAKPRHNDWYVQVSYFEQHASVVRVTVLGRDGATRAPVGGSRLVLHGGPGGFHLLFRATSPVAIRIQSLSPATNLCVVGVQLGFPYAAKASS
jgi:hypothetical protein